LRGCSFFTTLDLSSGYWQMALDEEAKEKTAFITHKGLFQFEVLAFGLSNAVSAFQRQMENILEGLSNSKCYLDDIMTHSKSFDDHLEHLELVFKRLEGANLKLKPSKCLFAARETLFLGFVISSSGVLPCEELFVAI
ncbi:MAG: reverse transcriptase family protein, partial [Sediminibacterium sp.]